MTLKGLPTFVHACETSTNEEYPVSQLLDEMKNSKSNMAIVGSTNKAIGIVTLEDILEEILGDIQDEHD